MIVVNHAEIRRRIKSRYTEEDVGDLLAFLDSRGTFRFAPFPTGLYPAISIDHDTDTQRPSGYGHAWVRDNIYVALAHEAAGRHDVSRNILEAIAAFYRKHSKRFKAILEGRTDPKQAQARPHIRFNGATLRETSEQWPHAQNDALGYFLWLYCRLARAGGLAPDGNLLSLFVRYFEAIRYWKDEDSGHWEERPKIEASSIGAVLAGLRALRELVHDNKPPVRRSGAPDFGPLDRIIAKGEKALASILPSECVQSDPLKHRRYDAALLFLAYPLDVVDDVMGQRIVGDVIEHLQGAYGIRRYLGDSYWTADYKEKVSAAKLTAVPLDSQEARDALARPGEEAQWCIFDPIISVIAGRRYLRTHDPNDFKQQVHYLNRSLGQLTGPACPQGEFRCPEAYYLQHGRYIPNDQVPLLWTQANLWLALLAMKESAAIKKRRSAKTSGRPQALTVVP